MRSRLAFAVFVAFGLLVAVLPTPQRATAASGFTDVPVGVYYAGAVDWLVDQGITQGTSPTTFSPDDPVTRGQMAAFLYRYGQDDNVWTHPFTDVPAEVYYENAVGWLAARGITQGTSPTTYSPDQAVTRAQMAAFLWRYAGEPVPVGGVPFSDVPSGVYYTEAVAWLVDKGITQGTSATTFSPDDTVTRGQMAAFLWRLAREPAVGSVGVNRIDPDKTLVLDAPEVSFTALNIEGTSVLTYVGPVDVGDVIVMGIAPQTPTGFIGMVTQVNGNEVTTAPASLMDAIPEADFSVTVPLDSSQPFTAAGASTSGAAASGAVFTQQPPVDFDCGGEIVTVTPTTKLTPGDVDFTAQWGWSGPRIEASWSGFRVDGEVTVTAGAGVTCSVTSTIDGPPMAPVWFQIGPVPVVVVPVTTFEINLTGTLNGGVTFGGGFSAGFGGGIVYDAGTWSTYTNREFNAYEIPPQLYMSGSVTAEVLAGIRAEIFGVGGPYLDFGPKVELAADVSLDPWWTLDAGLSAGMGASLHKWGLDLSYDLPRFQLVVPRLRIAQAAPGPPPDPLCVDQTSIPTIECGALVALYNSTNGPSWTTSTGWLTDPDPCAWFGVTCTSGVVTNLDLWSNQLTGTIPPAIGNLTNLTTLAIDSNPLTGSIPPELGNLTNLTTLKLADSQLTGPIPPELGNLTNLTLLDLSFSQLSGSIPPELGNLTKLTLLYLSWNQLTGSIPSELGNLTNLNDLDIGANQLTGSIPSELGNLTNLTVIILSGNPLTGPIPAQLGNLTSLDFLGLQWNQLSGTIPLELGNLTNLTALLVNNNQLSGPVPPELTNLSNLRAFSLRGQSGCLTAGPSLTSWLASFDAYWNDGCPPP